jgi:hypothetical protein
MAIQNGVLGTGASQTGLLLFEHSLEFRRGWQLALSRRTQGNETRLCTNQVAP